MQAHVTNAPCPLVNCANCHVKTLCTPAGATPDLLQTLDGLVQMRKRLKFGTVLYHAGSHCYALYVVKAGFIKTECLHEDGRVQVTGFYMAGEMFGFDGVAADVHACTAIALEDSEICIIPLARINHHQQNLESLRQHFYKLMSREVVRDHAMMMTLGSMDAEERLATFMLNLSQRFHLRGYSPYQLVLRMKREEIGSYLGLKVETISRLFSKFQHRGLMDVRKKNIHILDANALREKIGVHVN